MFRIECYRIHKEHNAEDVRLKARPVGRYPEVRLCVIAFYHARFMQKLAYFQSHALILTPGCRQNL